MKLFSMSLSTEPTPLPTGWGTRWEFLLAILIFISTFTLVEIKASFVETKTGTHLNNDTPSYLYGKLSEPWLTVRTPGYQLYLTALGDLEALRNVVTLGNEGDLLGKSLEEREKVIVNNPLAHHFFKNLAIKNNIIFSIGITFLCFCLAKYIPPYSLHIIQVSISFFIIFCSLLICRTNPIQFANADTIGFIFLPFSIGFILLYFYYQKKIFFCIACILSAWLFLIKPAYIFMSLICGLICAYKIIRGILQKKFKLVASFFGLGLLLLLLTMSWPIWLYMHGGIFVPSQLSYLTNIGYSMYFLQKDDEAMFDDPEIKDFIKTLIEKKEELHTKELTSHVKNIPPQTSKDKLFYYHTTLVPSLLLYIKIRGANAAWFSPYEETKFVNRFAPLLKKKYFADYLELVGMSFLSAFNYHPLLTLSHTLFISQHYLLIGIFIILALITSPQPLRIPIITFLAVHLTHIAVCSLGHVVESRYIATSEYCMTIAVILSLYGLLWSLTTRISKLGNSASMQRSILKNGLRKSPMSGC